MGSRQPNKLVSLGSPGCKKLLQGCLSDGAAVRLAL